MGTNNLTLRYTLTQFTFWAASTGAASFATTYLLGCGVPSGIIGVLLAVVLADDDDFVLFHVVVVLESLYMLQIYHKSAITHNPRPRFFVFLCFGG